MQSTDSFQQMINLLSNTLEAYTAAFFLKDPHEKTTKVISYHTLSKHFHTGFTCPASKSGVIDRVLTKRETVKIDRLGQEFDIEEFPFYGDGEKGIKGLFAVPVGRDLGVLYVDTKRHWGFNDKQQKLVWEFAAILETLVKSQRALEREKLYARMLRLWHNVEEQAEACHELGTYLQKVTDLCHKFVKGHSTYLFLVNKKKGAASLLCYAGRVPEEFHRSEVSFSNHLIKWVVENKKTLKVRLLETESKKHYLFNPHEPIPHTGSFLAIPMILDNDVAAIFGFLWKREYHWNRDELYILQIVVRRSSLVLEKFCMANELSFLENTDLVTELYNATGFEQVLEKKLAKSIEKSIPLVLAIIHLYPWIRLKATLTPNEEKEIRRQIARIFAATLGKKVVVGALRDDRYGCLFIDHTLGDAERKITRLKTRLMHECLKSLDDLGLTVTSSVALFPSEGKTASELLMSAYKRLLATTRKNS